jgi:two-component system, OmpR family, sensor histidine kinase KdpD
MMSVADPKNDVAVAPAFLSVMAHELTQPLAAALGSVSTVKQRIASGELDDAKRDQLLETTIRNLEQLQALLDSLRVFSEAETGELKIETSPLSIEDLFQDAREDFGNPASGTRIELICEPGLRAEADLMLFRQVLVNIINNAAKFSPNGSTVSVEAHRDNDQVVVSVSDEGGGFPPEEAERIFGKTVRLQPGKKGLGVGLFVAKAIVQAHGGLIWAENIKGGARFSFSIPAM